MLYFKKIFLGRRCQNACRSCGAGGREAEPPKERIEAAIREASAENVLFWGGEPLLRQDLAELVGLAARRGARRVKLRTNARGLDTGRLQELLEAGVYFFEVKVAGPDADVHDAVCGRPGAYDETCGGLASIRRVTELRGAPLRPYLECTVPIVRENLPLLAFTLQSLLPYEPDRVHFELADPGLSLLKVVPPLRAALENAMFGKVWATTLGLPPCVMAGWEPHVRENLPGAPSGRKLKPCKGCVLREVCSGVSPELVAAQGERQVEAQLSPFSSSRYLDSLRLLRQPLKVWS